MKYKFFLLRTVNLFLILVILATYQCIFFLREKDEKIVMMQTQINQLEGEKEAFSISDGNVNESEASGVYKDGEYSGVAEGFGGTIKVDVKVENHKIVSVDIISAKQEDDAYLSLATEIIDEIVEKQTAEVDTIGGATYSSTGIKNAVEDALKGAIEQ